MVYAIYKNGKRSVRRLFANYEAARQHVRKLIRKNVDSINYELTGQGVWDNISRNPSSYTSLGYNIRQV